WDDPRGESEALWKEMAQLGWLGLALPVDAGGSALGLVETAILQEELGRAACPSPYLSTVLAAMAIDRFGSPAQKSRWLPAVAGAAVAAEAKLPADALAFLLQRGAVGAAAEMLGAARRCLDMAVEYAKVREQFGQPIGSFQAIRHKCAEMLLEVENSHAATYYA